jgi:pimeloyl-ACP methyl ester carboxylesterase
MQITTKTFGGGEYRIGLVHGLGGEGATWQPLVDRLVAAGAYTVTTVDLRGHGSSNRAPSYRLDEFADDVVRSLPTGLDSVVGHSLGGAVLVRAVGRLQPRQAIYLDPGFQLALPTAGLKGRLFWSVPALTMGTAALLQARRGAKVKAAYDSATRILLRQAQERFDSQMALGVFREVAFNPMTAEPPVVPSTIVLTDDSPAVLSNALAETLEQKGWVLRRLDGIHHDMHLEDPDRTFTLLTDLFTHTS